MPIAAERREGRGGGQRFHISPLERGAPGKILHALETLLEPRGGYPLRSHIRQGFHQAQPQPQRRFPILASLERAFEIAFLHIDGSYFDTMLSRIAHELRRRIETHRLTVEQCAGKRRGFVMLQPGGVVRQESEARTVTFRKAVLAEPHHLLVETLCEVVAVVSRAHPIQQLFPEMFESSGSLPRTHRAA